MDLNNIFLRVAEPAMQELERSGSLWPKLFFVCNWPGKTEPVLTTIPLPDVGPQAIREQTVGIVNYMWESAIPKEFRDALDLVAVAMVTDSWMSKKENVLPVDDPDRKEALSVAVCGKYTQGLKWFPYERRVGKIVWTEPIRQEDISEVKSWLLDLYPKSLKAL